MTCAIADPLDAVLPTDVAPEDTSYVQRIVARASHPTTALQNHARNKAERGDAYLLALLVEQARENIEYGADGRSLGTNKALTRYREQASADEQYTVTCDYAFCRAHCDCDADSSALCRCDTDTSTNSERPRNLGDALQQFDSHLAHHDDGYGDHLVTLERAD